MRLRTEAAQSGRCCVIVAYRTTHVEIELVCARPFQVKSYEFCRQIEKAIR